MFDHTEAASLELQGARIHYEVRGSRDGPAVVFLHGGLGDIEDFNPLLTELDDSYRIVGIDSRGHGGSTLGTTPLTYARLQQDVCAILDRLDIANASIIGFSDGGIVAYRLAAATPQRVQRLITVGAPNTLPDGTKKILEQVTAQSWQKKFPDTVTAYERRNPAPDFPALVRAATAMWLDVGSTGYPQESIAKIAAPTLIVRGDDDHLFSLDEAVAIRKTIKNAKFLNVPAAGHVAFVDQAQICALAIRQFLDA